MEIPTFFDISMRRIRETNRRRPIRIRRVDSTKGGTQFNAGCGTFTDYRIAICSICRGGIFKGQEYHWDDGLIHDKCKEKKTDEAKNST